MEYSTKITMSKNEKYINMVLICAIASICVLGLLMAVYSLINSMYLFSCIYFVAIILGFSYVVMRINTIMPTFIAMSDEYIFIENWENGYFPFKVNKGFFGEFIPEKTVLRKIDIGAIDKLCIGSMSYLKKLLPDIDFYRTSGCDKEKYEAILKKMEFLYISTKDDKELLVTVSEYDSEEMGNLFKVVMEINEEIDFHSDNRIITKLIPSKKALI